MARVTFGGGAAPPRRAPVRLRGVRAAPMPKKEKRWYEDPNLMLGWVRLAEALAAPKGLIARGVRAAQRWSLASDAEERRSAAAEAEEMEAMLAPFRQRAAAGDPAAMEALSPGIREVGTSPTGAPTARQEAALRAEYEGIPEGTAPASPMFVDLRDGATEEQRAGVPVLGRDIYQRPELPPLRADYLTHPSMPLPDLRETELVQAPIDGLYDVGEMRPMTLDMAPAPGPTTARTIESPTLPDLVTLRGGPGAAGSQREDRDQDIATQMYGAGGRVENLGPISRSGGAGINADERAGMRPEQLLEKYGADYENTLLRRAEAGERGAEEIYVRIMGLEGGQAPAQEAEAPAPEEPASGAPGYRDSRRAAVDLEDQRTIDAEDYLADMAISTVQDVYKDYGIYAATKDGRLDAQDFADLWEHVKLMLERDPAYVDGMALDPVGTQRRLLSDTMAYFKFLNMGGDPDAVNRRKMQDKSLKLTVEAKERAAKKAADEASARSARSGYVPGTTVRSKLASVLNARDRNVSATVEINGETFTFNWGSPASAQTNQSNWAAALDKAGSGRRDSGTRLRTTSYNALRTRFGKSPKEPKISNLLLRPATGTSPAAFTWEDRATGTTRTGTALDAYKKGWNKAELMALGATEADFAVRDRQLQSDKTIGNVALLNKHTVALAGVAANATPEQVRVILDSAGISGSSNAFINAAQEILVADTQQEIDAGVVAAARHVVKLTR